MPATPPARLPWRYFDFLEPPRPVPANPNSIPDLDHHGAERTWKVTLDNRLIPFKIFRKPAPAPRPLLLILPGMGLPIASFHGIAPYLLHSHDLALLDYSALSCESSNWPHGGVPVKTLAHAVWSVADALHTEKFSLAGNSLGGAMCLVCALTHPHRIDRILLANPACYPQSLPFMYRLARVPLLGELLMTMMQPGRLVEGLEYIGYADKNNFQPELRFRYLHCMTPRRNRFRLMEMIRHLPSNPRDLTLALHLPRLHEIHQKVLITWGEQDPLLLPGSGQRLALALPNATYKPHPHLAHMPHEESPQTIGPEWQTFLTAST
jgi:pimeloyl-ACP methyl ester carboxylesterase